MAIASAVRWLRRLLEEDEGLTIEDTALAASALAALGGRGHEQAHATLSALAKERLAFSITGAGFLFGG